MCRASAYHSLLWDVTYGVLSEHNQTVCYGPPYDDIIERKGEPPQKYAAVMARAKLQAEVKVGRLLENVRR